MSNNPERLIDFITFCEQHADVFQGEAVRIGISASQAQAYKVATDNARAAYDAAVKARINAKNATDTQSEAVRVLRRTNSDILRIIRGFAGQAPNPAEIYAIAEIAPPAPPAPLPPPGTPTDFRVALNNDGSITLRWKCKNPQGSGGVVYSLRRRLGTAGEWSYIGATGTRDFTDLTLPAGTASSTYEVQAQRSGSRGQTGQFTVQFGLSAGQATATIITDQTLKIAA
jgi:hypothetical protein